MLTVRNESVSERQLPGASRIPLLNELNDLVRGEVSTSRGRPVANNLVERRTWHGPIDLPGLGTAVATLIDRHTVLRTVFMPAADVPLAYRAHQLAAFQRYGVTDRRLYRCEVRRASKTPLVVLNALCAGEQVKGDILHEVVMQEALTPFVPKEPLLRVTLVHSTSAEHSIILTVPSIASDVFSLNVLWRDLVEEYRRSGDAPGRDPCRIRTFAEQQLDRCERAYWSEAMVFWTEQWDAFCRKQCVTDELSPRSEARGPRGPRVAQRSLSSLVVSQVRNCALREQLDTSLIASCAFALALARRTGRRDVAWWSYWHNRTEAAHAHIVGNIANEHLLGLQVDCLDEPWALLKSCKQHLNNASRHQSMPAALIAQTGRRALAGRERRVSFVHERPFPSPGSDVVALGRGSGPLGAAVAHRGLSVWLTEELNALTLRATYWTDQMTAEDVEAFLRLFEDGLTEMTSCGTGI